jgi:protein TonB
MSSNKKLQKKSQKANLEDFRMIFFQIGLVIALLVTWRTIEYRSYEKIDYSFAELNMEDLDEEIIPITEEKIKPPPPPPPPPEVIEIVEEEEEIEEELEMEDTEADEDDIVEIEEDDDEIFDHVSDPPSFPGGDKALLQWIAKHTEYPPIAKEYGITGRVFVKFTVEKNGSISNVRVAREVDKQLDKEAIRVVSMLPNFNPGMQNGRLVRVNYIVPINFILQ